MIGTEPDAAMSLDDPVVAAEEQLQMCSNEMDNLREVNITDRDNQSANVSDGNSGEKRIEEVVYKSICEDDDPMFDEDILKMSQDRKSSEPANSSTRALRSKKVE